eukprot:Hpha_TRINITY_DN11873_c0_g2::TRINITY_DN11873_c0_g2_i1::g.1913::m.1913
MSTVETPAPKTPLLGSKREPSRCGMSVRWALSLGGIAMLLTSVSIATTLSLYAGYTALAQTNDACDRGLAKCFDSGAESAQVLGKYLLLGTASRVHGVIDEYWARPTRVLDANLGSMQAFGMNINDPVVSVEAHRTMATIALTTLVANERDGLQEVQLVKGCCFPNYAQVTYSNTYQDPDNPDLFWVAFFENVSAPHVLVPEATPLKIGDTVAVWPDPWNPSDGDPNIVGITGKTCAEICGNWVKGRATGTTSDGRWLVSVDGEPSRTYNRVYKFDEGYFGSVNARGWVDDQSASGHRCDLTAFGRTGTCPVLNLRGSVLGRDYLSWLPRIAMEGQQKWAPLDQKFGRLLSLSAFAGNFSLDEPGATYLMSMVSVNIVQLTEICRNITDNLPMGSRVYVVQTDPWDGTQGIMIAASHGLSYRLSDPNDTLSNRIPMNATESNDPVIAAHASHIFSEYGNWSAPELNSEDLLNFDYASVLYLTKLQKIESGGNIANDSRLLQHIALLVPRNGVYGFIDSATAATQEDIENEREATEESLEVRIIWMCAVVGSCFMILTVICVIFAGHISRPIQDLAEQMFLVGKMRVEEVDQIIPDQPSRLTEISVMQIAFSETVKQLTEYKKFLPDYVLNPNGGSSEDDMSVESDADMPVGGAEVLMMAAQRNSSLVGVGASRDEPRDGPFSEGETSLLALQPQGSNSSLFGVAPIGSILKDQEAKDDPNDGDNSGARVSSHSIQSRQSSLRSVTQSVDNQSLPGDRRSIEGGDRRSLRHRTARRGTLGGTNPLTVPSCFAQGLTVKRGLTLLVVRLRDFEPRVGKPTPNALTPSGLIPSVAAWVDRVESAAKAKKGLLWGAALGDGEISIVWGLHQRRFDAGQAAVDCCLDLTDPGKVVAGEPGYELLERCHPFGAVVEKPGFWGNMGGTRTLSGPVIVGEHRRDALRMLTLGREMPWQEIGPHTPRVLVQVEQVQKLLDQLYDVIPIDVVNIHSVMTIAGTSYPESDHKRVGVCDVLTKLVATNEEWMYQWEEHLGRTRALFHAFTFYRRGDLAHARSQALLALSQGMEQHKAAAKRLGLIIPTNSPRASIAGTPQQHALGQLGSGLRSRLTKSSSGERVLGERVLVTPLAQPAPTGAPSAFTPPSVTRNPLTVQARGREDEDGGRGDDLPPPMPELRSLEVGTVDGQSDGQCSHQTSASAIAMVGGTPVLTRDESIRKRPAASALGTLSIPLGGPIGQQASKDTVGDPFLET